MNRILWHVAACASALMLFPTIGGAQIPAASFDELRAVLKDGDQVFLTDSDGRRTRGRLVTVTSSSLDLMVEESRFLFLTRRVPRTFSDTAVTRVARIDSQLNGALIGLAAGSLPVMSAGCAFDPDWCGYYVLFSMPTGAAGMVIGALVDGMRNATVYRGGTPANRGATVSLSPLLTRRATGAFLNVRF